MGYKGFRIDPADKEGIHLVDVENGCERVHILFDEIPSLILDLKKAYLKKVEEGGIDGNRKI